MKKVVFAVCEGAHDVAFLYRIFTIEGFKSYKDRIKDLPAPVDSLILKALESIDYENLKLGEIRPKTIPQEVLFRGDTLILLYAVGGDSQKRVRRELLSSILSLTPDDENALDVGGGLDYSIVYFIDANDKGENFRRKTFEDEIEKIFGDKYPGAVDDQRFIQIKDYRVGCYIFANNDGYGTLEDIMIPIMEEGNEEVFRRAGDYLELKDDSRLRKLKINIKDDDTVEEIRSNKKLAFDEKKSKICIAGQLQNSGKANTVIIRDCDYINFKKIKKSRKCSEIRKFIRAI